MKTLTVDPQQGGNHYGNGLQPWDLQRDMPSTGDVFLDGRRTDVLEYVFRIKHGPDESGLQGVRRDAIKAMHNLQAMIARIDELEPPPDTCMAMEAAPPSYQQLVGHWLFDLFPFEVANSLQERCFRFFEEASELVQSLGMTYGQAIDLITYVWQRPIGEPRQELGGVMVTLNALAYVGCLDVHECAYSELARVNDPLVRSKIKAKQASKPANVISSLPGQLHTGGLIPQGPPVIVGQSLD